jgi:hypothetical protein
MRRGRRADRFSAKIGRSLEWDEMRGGRRRLRAANYERRRARWMARRVLWDIAARPSFDCLMRSN